MIPVSCGPRSRPMHCSDSAVYKKNRTSIQMFHLKLFSTQIYVMPPAALAVDHSTPGNCRCLFFRLPVCVSAPLCFSSPSIAGLDA